MRNEAFPSRERLGCAHCYARKEAALSRDFFRFSVFISATFAPHFVGVSERVIRTRHINDNGVILVYQFGKVCFHIVIEHIFLTENMTEVQALFLNVYVVVQFDIARSGVVLQTNEIAEGVTENVLFGNEV